MFGGYDYREMVSKWRFGHFWVFLGVWVPFRVINGVRRGIGGGVPTLLDRDDLSNFSWDGMVWICDLEGYGGSFWEWFRALSENKWEGKLWDCGWEGSFLNRFVIGFGGEFE